MRTRQITIERSIVDSEIERLFKNDVHNYLL